MPIVPMKKVTLMALKERRSDIMSALQAFGALHISELSDDNALPEGLKSSGERTSTLELEEELTLLQNTVNRLKSYDERKKPMLAPKPELSMDEISDALSRKDEVIKVARESKALDEEQMQLRTDGIRLSTKASYLHPWVHMDVPVQEIADTQSCRVVAGTVPVLDSQGFIEEVEALDTLLLQKVSTDRDYMYVLLVYHNEVNEEMSQALSRASFTPTSFGDETGTPAEILDEIRARQEAIEESQDKIKEREEALAKRLTDMEILIDALSLVFERQHQADEFGGTEYVFYLEGWVPKHRAEELGKVIEKSAGDAMELHIEEPSDDDEVPTLTENRNIITPFESITDMFGTPKPKSLDPNFTMAPFFVMFFGIMMSDAGYGILLALFASFIYFKTKPKGKSGNKLIRVIAFGGVFTALWGIIFGGWMGSSTFLPPLWFNPMQEPLMMLGLCFGLGIVHILVGMALRAYILIKRKQVMAAISEQLTWITLLIGIVLFAIPMLATMTGGEASAGMVSVGNVGKYMALVGLGGILVLGGYGKKGIRRITGGFASLYDITGYLSDVLSYSRLFALGLATGVVGMVINTIVNMLAGNPIGMIFAALVFIGGHIFNIAINALGAYVHSSRLQYIEFFGKFFEGGGKPFKPFAPKTKYYNVRQ